MDLNTIWFVLFGVLISGYAILDGFDLGVGVLHLITKSENNKRILMNAIGPVWDGNEVWLLTGGGALFAAFPIVYATVFSSLYLALYLVLVALMARAISMEFRGKVASPGWKKTWDLSFGVGSFLASVLFGVAVGNILRGLPIDSNGMYIGTFPGLLNLYSILMGIFSLIIFVMHGAIYMTMKTEGELKEQMITWASRGWIGFILLYLLMTILSIFVSPFLFEGTLASPVFWIFFILLIASIILIPIWLKSGYYFRTFLASSLSILSLIGIAAVSLFPRLVPSRVDLDYSLTIYNASSTPRTHTVMLIIALVGMPIVIAYTIFIYKQFKGKVELGEESY